MTSVTAHDYAWIRSSSWFRYALHTGYTLTLVRGVSPGDVQRVMAATPKGTCTGVDAFIERQDELLDGTDYCEESFISGAFTVPGADEDWTLVLHFDGGIGMQPRFLEALSAGGRAVTHSSNGGKPIHLFHWYEDGELRTTFEWATAKDGSTPDALTTLMREVGWTLDSLAAAAWAEGIEVGRSQVRRIQLAEGVRWRRARSWTRSKDPDFVPRGRGSSASTPTRPSVRR
ncbi:DUF6461 domain-containing protein [Streptomyces sp. HUAS TT20]|uniref:DUF6461 domain-containing protein n=1 Tax=Streptomyces sp. HUAS TT20 TaxID=3447509 RepID=UPI0021DA419A|nr:DUF6461 domain-containing protein [Streptomyces sp. HUAS 15-9]UXY32102.1 DUF6461 domain-containing protein [Streptomyces sp. HUAS 15-9]